VNLGVKITVLLRIAREDCYARNSKALGLAINVEEESHWPDSHFWARGSVSVWFVIYGLVDVA
jgi:hypothetical protein